MAALLTAGAALAAMPALLASPALAGNPTVLVRPGDTLSWIAVRYHTTVARLVAMNHLADPDHIIAGERLLLPASGSATGAGTGTTSAATASTSTHVIVAGESLTSIARRYGTTIAAIVRLNHIVNPDRIFAGERLRLPAGSRSTGSPAADGSTTVAGAGFTASVAARMRARTTVRGIIVAEARRAGVPVPLALAVAWQESGWQQNVVSSAGAIGVMQLTPATGAWVGMTMLRTSVNLWSTRQNVRAGVALLRHYLTRYHGDLSRVLAAYYQGQRSVDERGIYRVTRPYIASILALTAKLGG